MRFPSLLKFLQDQKATVSALASLLLGLGLGLLLRHLQGGGELWKSQDLVWLALPGNLFMRTLSCLSMPLVLPKLITAIGSMDLGEGGKSLGRVLLFYLLLNIVIETSGVLIFQAVFFNEEEISILPTNKTEPDQTVQHLPFSFALQDIIFNLAPDNIFTAPFRRYQTHISAGIEGNVNYTDSFSPDPNILGLVIVSSALGVAIARYKVHQVNKEPTGYFQGGRQGSACALLLLFPGLPHLVDDGLRPHLLGAPGSRLLGRHAGCLVQST